MPHLSTDAVAVHVDAMRGGKITSLQDRRTGREWLLRPEQARGHPAGYGSSFVEAELCGWDEMAPTIVACRLDGKAGDVSLPDHGELWSVAWQTSVATAERITMRGTGRALPYSVERTIEIMDRERLRLSYRLSNHGDHAFPVLWAAHPQFAWSPGCRIELPSDIDRVLDVTGGGEPAVVGWDEVLATRLDHLADGEGHKVWTLPGQAPGWSRLRDPDGGTLTLLTDPAVVPYLGIWWDARAFARERVVALEPSTGHYDDLAVAVAAGRVPWVAPGNEVTWDLDVVLEQRGDAETQGLQLD